MGRTDLRQFADRALDGKLDARLRASRDAGQSFDDIARELHAEGLPVSGETVRKWWIELERAAS